MMSGGSAEPIIRSHLNIYTSASATHRSARAHTTMARVQTHMPTNTWMHTSTDRESNAHTHTNTHTPTLNLGRLIPSFLESFSCTRLTKEPRILIRERNHTSKNIIALHENKRYTSSHQNHLMGQKLNKNP